MSAAFGFLKGALKPSEPLGASGRIGLREMVDFGLVGPAVEEAIFRAPLLIRPAPAGTTAIPFARAHLVGESHTVKSGALRFAEVAMGGLLYEKALRRWGFFGAVAAHASHNVAIALGQWVRGRLPTIGR